MTFILYPPNAFQAIEATGGWLTTFGSNIGVAKAVGDAVRDGQYFYEENGQVRRTLQCIGIAPWGSVRDRELMVIPAENITSKVNPRRSL